MPNNSKPLFRVRPAVFGRKKEIRFHHKNACSEWRRRDYTATTRFQNETGDRREKMPLDEKKLIMYDKRAKAACCGERSVCAGSSGTGAITWHAAGWSAVAQVMLLSVNNRGSCAVAAAAAAAERGKPTSRRARSRGRMRPGHADWLTVGMNGARPTPPSHRCSQRTSAPPPTKGARRTGYYYVTRYYRTASHDNYRTHWTDAGPKRARTRTHTAHARVTSLLSIIIHTRYRVNMYT